MLPGPGKILRWGVPDGRRAADGAPLHDDFVVADSLVALLDKMTWRQPSHAVFVPLPQERRRNVY